MVGGSHAFHVRGEDGIVYEFVRTFTFGGEEFVRARRRHSFKVGNTTQNVFGMYEFNVPSKDWSAGNFTGPEVDETIQNPAPPVPEEVTEAMSVEKKGRKTKTNKEEE